MNTPIKEIMINKGDKIRCLRSLKVNGIQYFTEGNEYLSPDNNCLKNDFGEDNFVSQQYLPYFFV